MVLSIKLVKSYLTFIIQKE